MEGKMKLLKKQKFTTYNLLLITIFAITIAFIACTKKEQQPKSKVSAEQEIAYYICGMHPSVRVSPRDYAKGKTLCPICNMKLMPVYKEVDKKTEDKVPREILFYRHPTNPEMTSMVPTKDRSGTDFYPSI